MGNSNTTRKITVPNEDPTSVIKVSDAVVQRLKGKQEKEYQGNDGGVRDSPHNKSNTDALSSHIQQQPNDTILPTLTSLQIRQEKEAELRSNDSYWENRLTKLKQTHKKMNQNMEEEYENAVLHVEQSFQHAPKSTEDIPCQDAKEVVMKCYLENPREALLCSKQVKEFQACVDLKRNDMIANKG